MPKINILPAQLADMIAAGEVVERPASAVKELLENAFDAGARNVTVEIRSGGAEYIRVTDDGCGMAPEDAGVCFLRHATSKLRDEKGLEAIGTMGFRGEALAAIGAVSHVELTTRERGADCGVHLTLDGGEIADMRECGAPEGTTVIIRGLFYNTPARLKFMKTDRAEGAACSLAALRCALGRPEVSVRLIRDGAEEFFTAGDGRAQSAIYSLLGSSMADDMLQVGTDDSGIAAEGFVTSPRAGRGSRSAQFFFVNGRYIKSQLLQAAVEQAFRGNLLVGRFPGCVIYLTIAPGAVDVNVHPAKTEVKFSQEKRVYDAVYYAVLGALEKKRAPAERPGESVTPGFAPDAPARRGAQGGAFASGALHSGSPAYQTRLDMTTAKIYTAPTAGTASPASGRDEQRGAGLDLPARTDSREETPGAAFAGESRTDDRAAPPRTERPHHTADASPERPQPAPAAPASFTDEAQAGEESGALDEDTGVVKVLGEALGVYIVAEQNGAVILIDKHAAHERILFDKLRANDASPMSQALLAPEPVTLSPRLLEALEGSAELIRQLGFEVEPYGRDDLIIRAVPDGLDPADAAPALEEALDALVNSRRLDKNAARDEVLKTVACKAAIKAGRSSDSLETQKLAEAVCSGEVRYCPHGRPVSVTLTRGELDRMFKRIV